MQATQPEILQYFAGFLDGDGSVVIPKPRPRDPRPSPVVSAYQSCTEREPPELKELQKWFKGRLYLSRKASESHRAQWMWKACSPDVIRPVLRLMSTYGIVKREVADIALAYLDAGRSSADIWKEKLSKATQGYLSATVEESKITPAYTAGLFVAEGCIRINRGHGTAHYASLSIAQLGCPQVLHALSTKFGVGSVHRGEWFVAGSTSVAKLLSDIKPHIQKCQKRRQVRLVEKFLSTLHNPSRSKIDQSTLERREKWREKLRKMKRR